MLFIKEKQNNIEFLLEGKSIGIGNVSNFNIPQEVIEWCHILYQINKIANYFDIDKDLKVNLEEFWKQKWKIKLIYNEIVNQNTTGEKIEFYLKELIKDNDLEVEFLMPYVLDLKINRFKLILVIAFIGHAVLINN